MKTKSKSQSSTAASFEQVFDKILLGVRCNNLRKEIARDQFALWRKFGKDWNAEAQEFWIGRV